MKKVLFLISIPIVFLLASCQNTSKVFYDDLDKIVSKAELSVNRQDSMISEALDNQDYALIIDITKNTSANLLEQMRETEALSPPANGVELLQNAQGYIESLLRLSKVQAVYSNFSDTISVEEAGIMDAINIKAIDDVELRYVEYVKSKQIYSKTKGFE